MRVQESELDLGFELLEKADRDLAADLGVFGIISGAVPAPHTPVPDLSIDLTSPARAYDRLGQRIFFGTDQTVDCSTDLVGIPTAAMAPGRERWLGVFLRFERQLSDPRTDGNSQRVYFRRDESFELVVRQAPEAPAGAASRVALQEDELLLCDIRLEHGQTQILDEHIDLDRRQAFIFASGGAVDVLAGLWTVISPAVATVQAALDSVDSVLSEHFAGSAHRHEARHVTSAPHGFVDATTVQGALDEIVDDLAATTSGTPGSRRVGADAAPGTPNALAASTVDQQLSQLLAWLNAHLVARTGAHAASAISAEAHEHITSTTVQTQLQEIVDDLRSTAAGLGAAQVGNAAITGDPLLLETGTVRLQLSQLLSHLIGHTRGGDHDERYYNVGEQVSDADTLDGLHGDDLALAGHTHDERYLRQVLSTSVILAPAEGADVGTLSEQPALVQRAYSYLDPVGLPEPISYVHGALSDDVRLWVTKRDSGGGEKDYTIRVNNSSSEELFIVVTAFAFG